MLREDGRRKSLQVPDTLHSQMPATPVNPTLASELAGAENVVTKATALL